mgnify:CR=1 FL=1
MKSKLLAILLFCSCITLSAGVQVIPMPQSVNMNETVFNKDYLDRILYVRDGNLGSEAYEIRILESVIIIRFSDNAGRFYAHQTLKQLAEAEEKKKAEEAAKALSDVDNIFQTAMTQGIKTTQTKKLDNLIKNYTTILNAIKDLPEVNQETVADIAKKNSNREFENTNNTLKGINPNLFGGQQEVIESKKDLFTPNSELQEIFNRIIVVSDCAHGFGAIKNNKKARKINL